MAKRRVQKKHFAIIREHMERNKPVPLFYVRQASRYLADFIDYRYLTIFRPWWYEQDWKKYNLSEEHRKFFDDSLKAFESVSRIDLHRFSEERKRIEKPKKQRNREPREEKPAPIRRLRRPEEFQIRVHRGPNKTEIEVVMGEKVFERGGFVFFAHHNGCQWVVSDKVIGAAVAFHHRYKAAVKAARERIDQNFEKYVSMVEKFKAS